MTRTIEAAASTSEPAVRSPLLATAPQRVTQLALAASAAIAMLSAAAGAADPPKPAAPPAVLVQPAKIMALDRQFEFIGRVEAQEKVELRARVKGFLGPRRFTEGELVKKNQILFTIEREPFEAVVAQRKAQLASAKATFEFAKQQLDRAQELSQSNSSAISKTTIDQRISEEQRANAGVLEAQAALTDAEINLSYTEIKSPIDGRVGRSAVSPGNLVSPETGVLATVVAEDPVYVLFPVTQRELLDYRRRTGGSTKLSIQVKLADGSIYDQMGRIDFLDVQVDPRTDGQIVRATMPNPNKILTDGQTIRVVLAEASSEKGIVIPRAAVIIDQTGPYILIVNAKNVIEQRRLKLGPEKGGSVAVIEGLAENDMVVVQGLQRIRPGVTVSTQMATSPTTSTVGKSP